MTPKCDDGEWLPLGVFATTHDNHPKADLILQLAVYSSWVNGLVNTTPENTSGKTVDPLVDQASDFAFPELALVIRLDF